MNKDQCCCSLAKFSGVLRTPSDYIEITKEITKITTIAETPVITPYGNVGLKERWFKCSECGSIWRLVDPEPPFNGLLERV